MSYGRRRLLLGARAQQVACLLACISIFGARRRVGWVCLTFARDPVTRE